MKYKTGILTVLLCMTLVLSTAAVSALQAEPDKPKTGDAAKTNDIKDKKPGADSTIAVRFKISAENTPTLPTLSKVELSGADESCKKVQGEQPIESGQVTFTKLPVCKIRLKIFITGFDTKTVSVDLANYKEPMLIFVKSIGDPVVTVPLANP
jgi:hypothetical protein